MLKLHLTKTFFNIGIRILSKLVPEVRVATYPQTQMIANVSEKLENALKIEVAMGMFDGVKYQTLDRLKDRNFQRLLKLSVKVLLYFSETDRYYRQWLGLFMLLVSNEVDAELEKLSFKDFLALMEIQWEMNMHGAVPKEFFEAHKKEFLTMVLANYLMNLT